MVFVAAARVYEKLLILVGECRAFLASESKHTMTVSARAILAYYNLHLGNMKFGETYRLGQASKSAANASVWTRVLWLGRSRIEDQGQRVKILK
jgi:hypothetical protein